MAKQEFLGKIIFLKEQSLNLNLRCVCCPLQHYATDVIHVSFSQA